MKRFQTAREPLEAHANFICPARQMTRYVDRGSQLLKNSLMMCEDKSDL